MKIKNTKIDRTKAFSQKASFPNNSIEDQLISISEKLDQLIGKLPAEEITQEVEADPPVITEVAPGSWNVKWKPLVQIRITTPDGQEVQ